VTSGRIFVVIVNYNSAHLVNNLLRSLRGSGVTGTVIVDNAAGEKDLETLRAVAQSHGATLVERDGNDGFAAGVHAGVDAIPAPRPDDLLWVLNPDTELLSGSVATLAGVARDPQVGMATPLLVTGASKDPRIWFAGGDIDVRAGSVRHRGSGEPWRGGLRESWVGPTHFCTGAAPMMRLDVWRSTGGFDRSLFMYWEDVDLSLKIQRMNLSLAVVDSVVVWHKEGGSAGSSGRGAAFYYHMARNRHVIMKRHHGPAFQPFSLRGLHALGWLLREAAREDSAPGKKFHLVLRGIRAGGRAWKAERRRRVFSAGVVEEQEATSL